MLLHVHVLPSQYKRQTTVYLDELLFQIHIFFFFSRTIETSQQLNSENWHVIALVMDNDDSKLYIDGQISFQSSIKFELQTTMKLTLTGMESSPLQIVT